MVFLAENLRGRNPCRLLFLLFLLTSAGVIGWGFHRQHQLAERKLAESQFHSIAMGAAFVTQQATLRTQAATEAVATMFGVLYPDAETWPFASMLGYNRITDPISRIAASKGVGLGLVTFMSPAQIPSFNELQNDYLGANFEPPNRPVYSFPQTQLERPLGPSRYNISAPLSHVRGSSAIPFRMLDVFSTPLYRPIIEDYLFMSEFRSTNANIGSCGIHSAFVKSAPTRNVVGMSMSPIHWDEVLETAFQYDVSGIDCVIESSDNSTFAFSIQGGKPNFVGFGQTVEEGQLQYKVELNGDQCDVESAVQYTATFYPSDGFYEIYSTAEATSSVLGAIAIVIFTSILFFLYDRAVDKDMDEKESILEAKRKFIRFISHEVRTPLNSVSMGLTVIREDIKQVAIEDNPEASVGGNSRAEALENVVRLSKEIQKSAEQAVDILNDVLNYDKIESGQLSIEKSIIDIWSLAENITFEFVVPAQAKDIKLSVDFSKLQEKPNIDENQSDEEKASTKLSQFVLERKVVGDSIRLAQVVRNLISNALKFTPSGGTIIVRAEIVPDLCTSPQTTEELSIHEHHGRIECTPSCGLSLSVVDSGVGMTPDQVSSLFGQGVQFNVNTLQEGKGSGLGLFIAKGIVEQHGGTLKVSSRGLGLGTTCLVSLPLYLITKHSDWDEQEDDQKSKGSIPRSQSIDVSSNTTGMAGRGSCAHVEQRPFRALVADDAIMNRKLLSRLLENRGWECDLAQDGSEAVDIVKKRGHPRWYDIIFLDYEMPFMNGPNAAKEIRKLGCESKLIGVTGNILPGDIQHFLSCGAMAVLAKPVKMEELEKLLFSTSKSELVDL